MNSDGIERSEALARITRPNPTLIEVIDPRPLVREVASLRVERRANQLGVSTWLVYHGPADLTAQSDDGTALANISAGLLSDIQTRIILRQPPDQVAVAAELRCWR